MKKTLPLFIVFVVILIGITSCKKTNNSSAQVVLLSEFIKLDTMQQTPNDTLEVDTYKYDNSNRWIYEDDIVFNDVFPAKRDSGYENTTTNFYVGTSAVPYLDIITESQSGVLQTTNNDYLLSYSPQGLLLKDSDVETDAGFPDITIVYNNTYTGSTITQVSVDLSDPTNPSYDTVTQTKLNGNIIAQVGSVNNADGANFTASFDTHPFPFPDTYLSQFVNIGNDNVDFGQKNNLIEIQGPVIGTPTHYKYQYTYNTNGYPATVIEYDWSSGNPVFVYKGIYIYQ
jgi:hypothetical protein